MKNKYIVHTAIKCSDGKVHRLSYDLVKQTEGSVKEFGRVFTEIERRFPDVRFAIQQYPEHEVEDLNDPSFISIHEPTEYTENKTLKQND